MKIFAFKSKFKYLILFTAFIGIAFYMSLGFSSNQVGISFYHWKSEFNPSEEELQKLKACHTNRIYLHLFDVDKPPGTSEAVPKAKLKLSKSIPSELQIIPVVYITNRTFEKATSSELQTLTQHISNLSHRLLGEQFQQTIEFQIDCDWTLETKDAYFEFLRYLAQSLGDNLPLSATIRLHQVKYHLKTGIPPVSRGMLMFYNMGNVKVYSSKNSIYDYQTAAPYLEKLSSYPLPLDYALPLFSWKIHYRLGNIKAIISEITKDDLLKTDNFININQLYICKKEGFIGENYFLKGDVIKVESIPELVCKQAAEQLSNHLNSDEFHVVLYHLGSEEFQHYDASQLKNISTFFN
jgi:hypothetical protein